MRARLADTPEASRHTSIGCRILARVAREGLALEQGLAAPEIAPDCEPEPEKTHEADDWPCPINEQDCAPLLGPAPVESVATSQALFRMTASSCKRRSKRANRRGVLFWRKWMPLPAVPQSTAVPRAKHGGMDSWG